MSWTSTSVALFLVLRAQLLHLSEGGSVITLATSASEMSGFAIEPQGKHYAPISGTARHYGRFDPHIFSRRLYRPQKVSC